MNLKLTPKAHADLSDIWDYTDQKWGSTQAETYVRTIWQTIETLKTDLNASQNADFIRAGYRKIQSGSHVIFFKQTMDTLTVIRIIHQQMDITRHLPNS